MIGTRHGEKLHETLLSREEMVKAADHGDYFRVPLDARSLEYELYFERGRAARRRGRRLHLGEHRAARRRRDPGAPARLCPRCGGWSAAAGVKVLLTGADGFLGWHTRVRLRAHTDHEVVVANRARWSDLRPPGAEAPTPSSTSPGSTAAAGRRCEQGNIELAATSATRCARAVRRPRIVFANSIQAGNDTAVRAGQGRRAPDPGRGGRRDWAPPIVDVAAAQPLR